MEEQKVWIYIEVPLPLLQERKKDGEVNTISKFDNYDTRSVIIHRINTERCGYYNKHLVMTFELTGIVT